MEFKHCKNLLDEKLNKSITNDSAYIKDKKNLENTTNDIKRMEQEIGRMNYEDGQYEQLNERKTVLTQECRELKRQLDRKNAHRFDFHYENPEQNFNRNSVKGMVCKLFDVRDKVNCLALEISAGGRLYNVVTDTDVTSKKVLQNGQLQSRTTFIPMNKISARSIDNQVVQFAQSLVGKDNVASALSLIQYDREFEPVMKFVFGSTLICKNMDVAKQVTYHRNINCRSVTLDGDIMDPDGSLSGGSRPKGGAILVEIADIKQLQNEYNTKELELRKICVEISRIEPIATKYNQFKEQIDLKKLELERITQSITKTSYHQEKKESEDLKLKLETLKAEIKECEVIQQNGKRKIKDIEDKLADSKGHQERELRKAGDEMKRLQKKSDESSKNWKNREQQFETFQLEIVDLKKSIETAKQQAECLINKIMKLEDTYKCLTTSCAESSAIVNEMKNKIKIQKDKIHSENKNLRQKIHHKDKVIKNNQDLELNIKKQENDIVKIRSDNKDAKGKISGLEKKYEWIKDDVHLFGVPNSRYDYEKEEPVAAGRKLTTLTDEKEKMGRNINQKAMLLLQREEEQYKEVMKHKRIVEEDKKKIQHIILSLDEKKKQAVKKAWNEVDGNFGGIFSSLLPGTNAKLTPPAGLSYYQGLEVKVAFNGLWKESLTELSGGQRSLVALSLILAMLKFKPAPLYILDEVDAALDLSHTQNIGNMLKAHFRNSQFVIVSLKDGMFNNANVLFRTKFIDGMSGVTRTVNLHNMKN